MHQIRILHVVEEMSRAGAETWLVNILREADKQRFQMDFLVHTDKACAYDSEVRELGGHILRCPYPRRPLLYAMAFRRLLAIHGPYDVIHAHTHYYSGWVLWLAAMNKIPVRIFHSHTLADTTPGNVARRLYVALMNHAIRTYSTARVAVSVAAGETFAALTPFRILHCGIPLNRQTVQTPEVECRRKLGIPPSALVIGHVGRFAAVKNHSFLLSVLAEVRSHRPDAHLLLIGSGPLEQQIRQEASRLGLSENVTFAGDRDDVSTLLLGAIDVFVFPSLHEGLGLAAVEAQAAGLPCIIAQHLPVELDVIPELIHRLDLTAGPQAWADAVLLSETTRMPVEDANERIRQTDFNISISIAGLTRLYEVAGSGGYF